MSNNEPRPCYLGIDNGTQGLSVILTDATAASGTLPVLATAEGASYDFVPDLADGCFEQRASDWDYALQTAMKSIHEQMNEKDISFRILAIGISGQMHGEVLLDQDDKVLCPVRLWCDARNEAEGLELTKLFGTKVAKRATVARFLWTIRNRRDDIASHVKHMTTPAGYLAFLLTNEYNLGIGDASGMFPMDGTTHNYHETMLHQFDRLVNDPAIAPIRTILPNVRRAGEPAGQLTAKGAQLLGLSEDHIGIPVAPAEGDQVASLAGSLIGQPGNVSCSFGTSVCANTITHDTDIFEGVSPAIDHFCAADGKPILMVWLRNGTTYLNTIVNSYGMAMKTDDSTKTNNPFETVMPMVIKAPADCGGLLALPFMNDEPGLQVSPPSTTNETGTSTNSSTAVILGLQEGNATPGNIAKAALVSTMFNLKLGRQTIDQHLKRPDGGTAHVQSKLILSGGLTKTPACGQILANVFDTPVVLLQGEGRAEEGCCWGAAVMARYRHMHHHANLPSGKEDDSTLPDWPSYLDSIAAAIQQEHDVSTSTRQETSATTSDPTDQGHVRFTPNPEEVVIYEQSFGRYQKLIQLQPSLANVML